MVSAYVLIKLEGGVDPKHLEHVREHPEIKSLAFVLGPFDVVLECQVESFDDLGRLARELWSCPGVSESATYPVIQ